MSAKGPDPKKTLYLVDISSFIFRAFYAIRILHNRKGEPTNAIYGVATMLAKLFEQAKPEYIAVTYDSKEPSFRHEVYEKYKANRSEPPEDLLPQFDRIAELVESMGLPKFRQSGIEADDLIATLTKRWVAHSKDHHVVVVTGDKDLMQLVSDQVEIWDTMNDRHYDAKAVQEKFGVTPAQIRDYLALVGDSSDNIPGAPGIGPKTAVQLLTEYGTLENVLKAATEGKISGKKGIVLHENRKLVELSRDLVTLREDIGLEVDEAKLQFRFELRPECVAFLMSMDFHTLVARWQEKAGAKTSGIPPVPGKLETTVKVSDGESVPTVTVKRVDEGADPNQFRTVNTERGLLEICEGIHRTRQFGFDLETTSLNAREAEIVGISICYDREFGCYIPIGHRGTQTPQLGLKQVMSLLAPVLENPKYKKIGQNLKYDWSVLLCQGYRPDGVGADTMVAGYLLDPSGRSNLEALCLKHLEYKVMTYEEVCGKGKDQICFDQVSVEVATRYSAEDALCAYRLWDVLRSRLNEEKLMRVFAEIDLPLVQILAKMECAGVAVDSGYLKELSREFDRELLEIEKRIQTYTKGPVNLNSTKQLAQLLFEELKLPPQGRTKTGFSTDADVLEALAPLHEVPRLLSEYREIAKLKGTYVDPLPKMVDAKTGRIHASFHQTGTATGRLSSSDPNLQNIPIRSARGQKIRRAFVAAPGNVLLSADYSQIELRLLAHMSGDTDLVESFRRGEDVHRRTASEIFSRPVEQVDDRQRDIAKAINFGLMYGKTAFGLSQELKIPRKEAQAVIDRYFQRYRGVKSLLDGLVTKAMETGISMTAFGRKRYLPEIHSQNQAVRANAERMAMNAPIQGTAADLIKLAMITLDEQLEQRGMRSRLVVQVHDELVLECPEEEAQAALKLVTEVMEGAMELNVPLKVNASIGKNWAEL